MMFALGGFWHVLHVALLIAPALPAGGGLMWSIVDGAVRVEGVADREV
jgi:hypothetical protein